MKLGKVSSSKAEPRTARRDAIEQFDHLLQLAAHDTARDEDNAGALVGVGLALGDKRTLTTA